MGSLEGGLHCDAGEEPTICDLRPRRKDDAWALPLHPLGEAVGSLR